MEDTKTLHTSHNDSYTQTQTSHDDPSTHANANAVTMHSSHDPHNRQETSDNDQDASHMTTSVTMDGADEASTSKQQGPAQLNIQDNTLLSHQVPGDVLEHAHEPAKPESGHVETAIPATSEEPAEEDQEWPLKSIYFPPFSEMPTEVKILMQDQNGPCSFLALCNVLLLRGDISLPLSLKSVKYSTLSTLLADYLLRNTSSTSSPATSNSLDFALNVLPKTLSGLDVNVDFTDGTFVSSSDTATSKGELELFKLAKVDIKHGWIASKEDKETWDVLNRSARDYDTAVRKMVDGDVVAGAAGVTRDGNGDVEMENLVSKLENEPEKQQTIYQATVIKRFLEMSSTQLTYAGLFHLSETLPPSSLCALFRNSHFSVLYRRRSSLPSSSSSSSNTFLPVLPQATLFHLVTDQALLYEPHAVWESLEDIDGAASRFFDASLQPARIGGDYVPRDVGKRSEERRKEEQAQDADMALAAQLQQDEYDREQYHRDQAASSSHQVPQAVNNTSSQIQQTALSSSASPSGGHRPEDLHSKQLAGLGVKTRKDRENSSGNTTTKESGKKSRKDCIIC